MLTTDLPHVLVVGEDAQMTTSMCEALASEQFQCIPATGSDEAFAIARKSGLDVALLDVSNLEAPDGLMLARQLRDETEDLGVVMIAASRSLEDLVDALRHGVVDYLSKPLGTGELAAAVQRAIDWRTAVKLSRVALKRHEGEMSDGALMLAKKLTDANIESSLGLDTYLEQLYGRDATALRHVRRVASASVLMAQRIKIPEPFLGDVERAALLHDIGKLAIPRSILRKPWPLSAGEHALARTHVRVAADALSRVPFLAPTAKIIGAIREHYDGRGYPDGLAGDAIPLGARIIAVAEVFDTLNASHGASARESISTANAELVREAGSRFDPMIINVWLRCLDSFGPEEHRGTPS